MPTQPAATSKPEESPGEALPHTPAEDVVFRLLAAGKTLAVAESCTGGLVAAAVTAVAGASRVFAGGFVVYSEASKVAVAGLPAALVARHGAVSAEVAGALAKAAAERFGADYGIATTGYAGPSGGDAADPVGTVYLGLHAPGGTTTRRVCLSGDRTAVRRDAVNLALAMLGEVLSPEKAPLPSH